MFRNLSKESVLYGNSSYNRILVEWLPQTFKISHDTSVQLMLDILAKLATSCLSAALRAATYGQSLLYRTDMNIKEFQITHWLFPCSSKHVKSLFSVCFVKTIMFRLWYRFFATSSFIVVPICSEIFRSNQFAAHVPITLWYSLFWIRFSLNCLIERIFLYWYGAKF
jgi:hypothetical protein